MKQSQNRMIGRFEGKENGPLIICIGAMHGNEPAGVQAIEIILKLLADETINKPDFLFTGTFVGLIGNTKAYQQKVRFLSKDLNRQFKKDNIESLQKREFSTLDNEDQELIELITLIKLQVDKYAPSRLVVLDLHTTSSFGGIFTICQEDPQIIKVAKALHAPVILGMLEGLQGTTLHYFTTDNMGVDTVTLSFESGQHEEQMSINRAVAGIVCCLREIGSLNPDDVENHHEQHLIQITHNLPKLTTLIDRYHILDNEKFEMLPGYQNFQLVKKGQTLAIGPSGNISAIDDGIIIMPLYQDKGEDGFFIVKEILS